MKWRTIDLRTVSMAIGLVLAAAGIPACSRSQDQAEQNPRADSVRWDSLARRRRAYEQERAEACQVVYKKEAARHNNVVTWKYDQGVDGCWVEYRQVPPYSEAQCDSMYPPGETSFLIERLLCHEGRFRTRF